MIKSHQVIQEMIDSPVMKIYQQATSDIKKYLEDEHDYEQLPDGTKIDLLISSEFANADIDGQYKKATEEMHEVMMAWTESMYCKFQRIRIEEEIEWGLRDETGELRYKK